MLALLIPGVLMGGGGAEPPAPPPTLPILGVGR